MKEFFKVTDVEKVFDFISTFDRMDTENVALTEMIGRVLATEIYADVNLPDFTRTIVDGYAVQGKSTFGASDGNPAYLDVVGTIAMGEVPDVNIGIGNAARISTGGMLPAGADSVVMIEHTDAIDNTTIEVYRSVAPGQNTVGVGEDFKKKSLLLNRGQKIRAQEVGLLAAFGHQSVAVYRRPKIGIISTGDEIVPTDEIPKLGQIRDINTYSLAAMVSETGAIPVTYGIIKDNFDALFETCTRALAECDMVLISGGSSVGTRDFTVEVISAFSGAEILVHGISISPGKPTILARIEQKAYWGLPGHVVSSMVVFSRIVLPFIEHISGLSPGTGNKLKLKALLTRNVSSAQGRVDYIRVRLSTKNRGLYAEPILGKSALLNTMVKADGLIEVDRNTEGLDQGTAVDVIPL